MSKRTGASLLETLVALAIMGLLLGLLIPAVQAARRKALETVCKNNLHQINLAIAQYAEANKRLPGPGSTGMIGGWTIDVLPYLDQKNLWDRTTPGNPIIATPDYLLKAPRILCCPIRTASDAPAASGMDQSDYVFTPNDRRDSYGVFDAPLEVKTPWASGPEMTSGDVIGQTGPHNRGFFCASGFQNGVQFIPDNNK